MLIDLALGVLGALVVLAALFGIGWRMASLATRDPCALCLEGNEYNRRFCEARNCPEKGAAL